jgi:putative ABC transport system permease protein
MVAGSTALTITGLGVLIGVPIGFAVVAGLRHLESLSLIGSTISGSQPSTASVPLTVPWLNLAVAALGVPLLTAAGAMLFTRSRVRPIRNIE